jgi:hypothetical protein
MRSEMISLAWGGSLKAAASTSTMSAVSQSIASDCSRVSVI